MTGKKNMYQRWIIFIISTSLFLVSQFYRASNAVIAPLLIRDLSLDTEELGLMTASFFYAFALTQIPVGILLDRVGPRRTMTVLSLVAVLGAVIFAWAESFSAGIIGRVLLGIGMACNLMGTLKLLTTWFGPATFATLSGIVISIGTLGNMVAATPLVLLVQQMGWRMTFTLIAGMNLIQVVIFYAVVRDKPSEGTIPSRSSGSVRNFQDVLAGLRFLLAKKDYWFISCGAFFRYGVFAAVQTLWAGPYLINAMGLSPLAAGNLIFLINIALVIGGPTWGSLSDRVLKTRKGVMTGSLVLLSGSILAIALLPKGAGLPILAFLFFCFGFSAATANVMFAHIKDLMPLELAGVALTSINFFTMLGAAVFSHGIGSLMLRFYPGAALGISAFRSAFLLCAATLLVAAFLYHFTRDAGSGK
ncbi:MAG: MFS transporter [Desulfobacterales bacterium]|nr:MFS transporter [Desulfobacterales bacterium]